MFPNETLTSYTVDHLNHSFRPNHCLSLLGYSIFSATRRGSIEHSRPKNSNHPIIWANIRLSECKRPFIALNLQVNFIMSLQMPQPDVSRPQNVHNSLSQLSKHSTQNSVRTTRDTCHQHGISVMRRPPAPRALSVSVSVSQRFHGDRVVDIDKKATKHSNTQVV